MVRLSSIGNLYVMNLTRSRMLTDRLWPVVTKSQATFILQEESKRLEEITNRIGKSLGWYGAAVCRAPSPAASLRGLGHFLNGDLLT